MANREEDNQAEEAHTQAEAVLTQMTEFMTGLREFKEGISGQKEELIRLAVKRARQKRSHDQEMRCSICLWRRCWST